LRKDFLPIAVGDFMISELGPIIILVLFSIAFYSLIIRNQVNKNRKHKELLSSLSIGNGIVTSFGLLGQIVKIENQYVSLEISQNVIVSIEKHSISQLLSKRFSSKMNK